MREFAFHLGRASLYVAPAWPLLVIAGSALLFVATAIFDRLFHVGSLKWLIDLGSLHAPFYFVHLHTVKSMCDGAGRARGSDPLLPLRHGGSRPRCGPCACLGRSADNEENQARSVESGAHPARTPGVRGSSDDVRTHRLQHFQPEGLRP